MQADQKKIINIDENPESALILAAEFFTLEKYLFIRRTLSMELAEIHLMKK